jgi:FAD/FMN-containing dehydrogenase
MELFPARAAHHMPIVGQAMRAAEAGERSGPATRSGGGEIRYRHGKRRDRNWLLELTAAWPDQAALARRIRRRRSEDRSSSFRPPHVPYFSGLLRA